MQVAESQQLELHRAGLRSAGGFLGACPEPQQRNEESGRKGGRSGKEEAAVGREHDRTLGR